MTNPVHDTLFTQAQLSAEEAIRLLQSDSVQGLSNEEAEARSKQYGSNTVDTSKSKNDLLLFLSNFKNPLTLILLAATIVSFGTGEITNGGIILGIIMFSVLLDFFQQRQAGNAAENLKQIVKNTITVIRNGNEQQVMPELLCPGDIVLLNAGKIVPADARIIESSDLYINQSSLTGESFPCEKSAAPVTGLSQDATIAALTNIVFMGSSVISGSARVVVLRTGISTEFGKIVKTLVVREPETSFMHGMKQFGYLILRVTLFLVLFIFLINAFRKHDVFEAFMFSLAIAVGLTPELLPMVMSVTMARGALNMAKKGVIIKKTTSIPNFGSMDVLCTDKTGTITEDKIELATCIPVKGIEEQQLLTLAWLNSKLQTGVKNPLDNAIMDHVTPAASPYSKIDEIPFDFIRRRMSVAVDYNNTKLLICKGAPEAIFQGIKEGSVAEKDFMDQYEALSAQGFRVLAVATKNIGTQKVFTKEDEQDFDFLGFITFLDPPKKDAGVVIAALREIGVEVKIITGDSAIVTQKICEQIGLPVKGIMQAHEVENMSDEALQLKARETTIFGRFSPEQKNRVIRALKVHHHAVGYMGDGINDVPSLRTADIGISVHNSYDVVKDAAGIILTQKDLSVLKAGILEGRKTFGNTMKYILMGLSSNFGNMFSVAAATLFLPFLPMLPVQILTNNFLYDASQLTIPSDNVDEQYTSKPHQWNQVIIRKYMFYFGLLSSVFDMITFYLLYSYFSVTPEQFRTGWFIESLSTQILVVFIIRTHRTPFFKSKPSAALTASTLSCLAIGWLLILLPAGKTIGFQLLPLPVLTTIVLLVIIYLLCAELTKWLLFRKRRPKTLQ